MAAPQPGERVVVVSPHLDDGVLSLGAAVSAWSRAGARVELLTALAGDPASEAPAGGWDLRGGFATEGEASLARRAEDDRACAVLGAVPVRLSFGYQDYERHGDEEDVRRAAVEAIGEAEAVLLPGSPLSHPDHEWIVRTLADAPLAAGRLGFYAEQPYSRGTARPPATPSFLEVAFGGPLVFAPVGTSLRDRLAKRRALRAYSSQLPLLALDGRALLGLSRNAELVAWVGGHRRGALYASRR